MSIKKRKRGQGEGCIYKRKDGTWSAVITLGCNDNGKQKRKFVYGKTRQEVSEKLNRILSSINNNTYIEPSKMLLNDWLDIWLKEYAKNNIKISTRASYDLYITKHIKFDIGKIPLGQLRGDMMQKFYNEKLENGRLDGKGGLSPKTIKNLHNMLHEALEQAVKNNIIQRNPSSTVTLPKVQRKEMRVLSPDEQQRLIEISKKHRLGIGIILDLFTGLRLGELLGLQWKDIDLENGSLSVRRTLNRIKNFDENKQSRTVIIVGDTKTINSKRQIPLHKIMVDMLKEYKAKLELKKQLAGEIYEDNDYVIVNEIGKFIEPRTYQDFFHKLIKEAGIEKANFHCLRHSFATRALERGIAAKTVSEILGHANISITLDLYSHVSVDLKKESIDKMSDLFI